MGKYEKLLSPIQVGGLTLRTRTLMSPMVANLCTEDGIVTERMIRYHVERAKNLVGLNIVEASYVDRQGQAYKYGIGNYSDECLPGMTKLAEAVHEAGGLIGIQIWHAGSSANPAYTGMETVSCSAVENGGIVPRELTKEEILKIEDAYAEGALRAKRAGFDLIEIHGTHGYLIDQFYSPISNQRTDEYGGSLENRMRFGLEVARKVRAAVGDDFPISFRLTGEEYAGEAGNHIDSALIFAEKILETAHVQILNVSGSGLATAAGEDMPEGVFSQWSKKVKEAVGDRCLVSVANRIKRPSVAEKILENGDSDLVTIGRALICDPEILTKAAEGREDEIRYCANCNFCIGKMISGQDTECMQNPMMGHEFEYDLSKKAGKALNVAVIGGGCAGMEAAVIADLRGHHVTLVEKCDHLGGKIEVASKAPYKNDIGYVASNLQKELEHSGVKILLSTKADKDCIAALKPDAVIIATGAKAAIPPVKGIDSPNVFMAEDILNGTKKAEGNSVVIGGGVVGMEIADKLLLQGNPVTVVEMLDRIMGDLFQMQQFPYLVRVIPNLKACMTGTKVLAVEGNKVITDKGEIDNVDSVVVAAGYKPVNDLEQVVKDCGIPVCVLGDASRPAQIYQAMHGAFKAALALGE